MTIRYSRANVIATARDAGGAAGCIKLYTGTRPGTDGGAITSQTLVSTLYFDYPSTASNVNGVLTATVNPGTASDSGAISWFREESSTGVFVADGDVSTVSAGTGDLLLNDVNAVNGLPISISTYRTTENN